MSQTLRVKHCSLFVSGRKVATVHTTELRLDTNAQREFGDPGFLGYSKGPIVTTCTATEIIPVSAQTTDLDALILAQADLDMAFGMIGGAIWQITMRAINRDYRSDARTGVLSGSIVFGGGEPTVTRS